VPRQRLLSLSPQHPLRLSLQRQRLLWLRLRLMPFPLPQLVLPR
jgi:hypothetical protein